MDNEIKYYVKIDTSNWNAYQKSWFKNKSIIGMVNHKKYGYVIPMENVDNIIKTKSVNVNIWPDNDSYNFWEEYDVEKIFVEKISYEAIDIKNEK